MRWACLTGWVVVCIVLYCIVGSGFSDGARCLCGSGITGSSPILVSLIDVSYLGRWGGPASLAEWSYVLYCIVLYCIVGNGLSDGAQCLCGSGITGSYPPIDSLIDVSHLWRWDCHASLTERSYVLYCIVLYCIVLYCIVGNGLSDGARCLCGSGITGSSPYPSQPDRRQPPMEMR